MSPSGRQSGGTSRGRYPRRGRRPLAALLLAAAWLTGCGGTAPPATQTPAGATPTSAPSPTTAPTPSPSPTPDIGATAADAAATLGQSGAEATLGGSLTWAAGSTTVEGTITSSASGSHTTLTLTTGKAKITSEHVVVDEAGYLRTGNGPWFHAAAPTSGYGPTSGQTLASVLVQLRSLNDAGLRQVEGVPLHRLQPLGTVVIGPRAFGFTQTDITAPDLTVELYAAEAGQPKGLAVSGTWRQTIGGKATAMAVDLQLTLGPAASAVLAPDDVWKGVRSKRFACSVPSTRATTRSAAPMPACSG